jgi:hypothetical protein
MVAAESITITRSWIASEAMIVSRQGAELEGTPPKRAFIGPPRRGF